MKKTLYATLAVICLILSSFAFVFCSGTVLAFCGLILLGIAAAFASLYFESRHDYSNIAHRLTDYLSDADE